MGWTCQLLGYTDHKVKNPVLIYLVTSVSKEPRVALRKYLFGEPLLMPSLVKCSEKFSRGLGATQLGMGSAVSIKLSVENPSSVCSGRFAENAWKGCPERLCSERDELASVSGVPRSHRGEAAFLQDS